MALVTPAEEIRAALKGHGGAHPFRNTCPMCRALVALDALEAEHAAVLEAAKRLSAEKAARFKERIAS